jgi:hypothetical protein
MDKPVKAIDGDTGINEQIAYRVPVVAGVINYFIVDSNTGALKLDHAGPPAGPNVVTVQVRKESG